jgi:hypothetical protein
LDRWRGTLTGRVLTILQPSVNARPPQHKASGMKRLGGVNGLVDATDYADLRRIYA